MFEQLRSPFTLRSVTFRNRIFSSGHQTLLAKAGLVTDAFIAYHAARARGGAGLIVTEAISVHESAYFNQSVPSGYLDAVLPGYRQLADAVHEHDCCLMGQLFHPGAEVAAFLEDGSRPVAWAPSAHEVERYLVTARPMSVRLIEDVIEGYGNTAARMVAGGFDGVEVMAHHGYLPIQFLNPRVNHRDDEYGGSLANRMRFLNAVHDNIRKKIGDEKVVGVRISTDEKTHTGLVEDEVIDVITALDRANRFDFFNIALGSSSTAQGAAHIVPPMVFEQGYIAPYAERVKQATSRAVFAVGRMNRPQDAEQALAAGHADMIGMTRAQICDPELGNKIEQDRTDEIRVCIACNQACIGHYALGAPVSCIQYPESGRELAFGRRTPTKSPRQICVVGGGPAGMKAAAVAAERGHRVILFEKAARVGGQALLAALLPQRQEFGGIVTNLEREMLAAGVDVQTGVEVTSASIGAANPDVVIIATGAVSHMPDLQISDGAPVFDAWQVIKDEVQCGDSVVIADWRGDLIGLGLALKLVQSGRRVRLATVANCAGINVQYYVRDPLIGELSRLGVEFTHYARLTGADEDTVYFQHASGGHAMEFHDTDTLVVCYSHRSVSDLSDELEGSSTEVHCIGDALTPRTAEEAVLEGLKAGCLV